MKTLLFVLWLWHSSAWRFGNVPMTPGWFSHWVAVDEQSCLDAVKRIKELKGIAICLPADAEWPKPQSNMKWSI